MKCDIINNQTKLVELCLVVIKWYVFIQHIQK